MIDRIKKIISSREIGDVILAQINAFESLDTLSIFGSQGSLHVPVLNEGHMKVITNYAEWTENHPPNPNFHEPLIEDFMKAVIENRQPRVYGRIGKEVNRILSEAYN